nr:keratin-associated protein 5-5-like [Penaeus vannamei]
MGGECQSECHADERGFSRCSGSCTCCVSTRKCSSTSWKCKKLGGACQILDLKGLRVCDFVDLTACPGCGCCISCRAQYNRTCRKLYDGSCKSKCDSTELEIHRCEAGCVCCGCRAKRKCASRGGLCVPSKAHCEGTAYSAWCDRSCVCCVPDKPCGWKTPKCLEHSGYCSNSCSDGEVALKGICGKGNCVCCVSDPSPCAQGECLRVGGRCSRVCPSFLGSVPELCPGKDCTCCLYLKAK